MRRLLLVLACGLGACALHKEGTGSTGELGPEDAAYDAVAVVDSGSPPDATTDDTADTAVAEASVEEASVEAGTDGGPDGGKCAAAKAGLAPCAAVPSYEPLAIGQTLDGKADDFCDLQFVDFDITKGQLTIPSPLPGGVSAVMKIRVAWSSFGLHAHFAVKDDKPNVYPGTDGLLYKGDSVEMYVAGTDALGGTFDGAAVDPGAQQIVIAPPQGALAARGSYFYSQVYKGPMPADRYFARTTAGGYEVELRLPWLDLAAAGVTAGRKIALTFAFNDKYDPAKPQAYSVFQMKAPLPAPSTCGAAAQPSCDDRAWCTPALGAP